MQIELPMSLGYRVPAEATRAAQEALDSEDAWRPLGPLWAGWSSSEHPDGKPVAYSTRFGTPSITLYPSLVPLMAGGRDVWSVANRLGADGAGWVRTIILHEVGHHRLRTQCKDRSFVGRLPEVSGYAARSEGERLAEAYALWRSRPELLEAEFGPEPGRMLAEAFG